MALDLSGKADLAWLSELIADVRDAAPDARFILAGAAARDVQLQYAHGIDTGRATSDVDLAFAVENWAAYEALQRALCNSGKFIKDPKEQQRLLHTGDGKSKVDLIPFAGIEDQSRQIAWPPDGSHVMNMVGFREAADSSEDVVLPNGRHISVASLPALMLLKLAAWKDRRLLQPRKDAQDIRLLLSKYLDAGNHERLYAEAAHLLEEENFDYERAGAWLLGHDARRMATVEGAPEGAHDYFKSIVVTQMEALSDSNLILDMRSLNPRRDFELLEAFVKAFCGPGFD